MNTGAGVDIFSIMPNSSMPASRRSRPSEARCRASPSFVYNSARLSVAAAGTYAADPRQSGQKRLEDCAGVVVEPAGIETSSRSRSSATPAAFAPSSSSLSLPTPAWPISLPATRRSNCQAPRRCCRIFPPDAVSRGLVPPWRTRWPSSPRPPCPANLRQLVERTKHVRRLAARPIFPQAG